MKIYKILIFIILITQSLFAQTSEEVLSLMTESKIYQENKKYSDALIKINEAIILDNKNAELYYLRGEIHFALNKYNESLKDYEKAIEINPDSKESLNGKILSVAFMGELKDALDLADEAIKNSPSDPNFYYSRGIINLERGKYVKASEDFDQDLSLGDKNEFRNFLYRGVAKLNLQEYDEALEDLNMAVDLDSKSASAYHTRGRIYYEKREYEDAIKDFETSLNFNPQNEVAYYNLGMTYYKMEDLDKACRYFNESCSMDYSLACKMILAKCSE